MPRRLNRRTRSTDFEELFSQTDFWSYYANPLDNEDFLAEYFNTCGNDDDAELGGDEDLIIRLEFPKKFVLDISLHVSFPSHTLQLWAPRRTAPYELVQTQARLVE